jgi:uncharacterized protein YuzE
MEIRDGNITTMANIDTYSKNANLLEVDKKGELVHDVTKISKARQELKKILIETKEMDSMVELELEEKGKARGGKMTSPHEKGVFDSYMEDLIKNEDVTGKRRT